MNMPQERFASSLTPGEHIIMTIASLETNFVHYLTVWETLFTTACSIATT